MAQEYNDYLKVKTIKELYDYLEQKLKGKYSVDLEEITGPRLYCYVNGVPFEICFVRGKRMAICGLIDGEDEIKDVLKVLSPIMWYRDPSSDPAAPVGPFIAYTTDDDMRVYEWDYVDPKTRMSELVMQQLKDKMGYYDIEIFHPGFSENPFVTDIKYGNFTGFLDKELIGSLQTCHEIELYSTLQYLFDKYDEVVYCAKVLDVDASEKLDAINYNIAYVAQQTKRFGIPMHEPTDEFEINCPEFYAWFEWWKSNIESLVKKYPELEKKLWTDDEILNIRPSGSYEEYLPLIYERFEQLNAEHALKGDDEEEYAWRDPDGFINFTIDDEQDDDSSNDKKQ